MEVFVLFEDQMECGVREEEYIIPAPLKMTCSAQNIVQMRQGSVI